MGDGTHEVRNPTAELAGRKQKL